MAGGSRFGSGFRPRLKQDEKSAETRRRLLDAAIECLVERGYANITSSEIAERAGLSRGAQLYHFPTKEELLTRAVEHLFDLIFDDLRERVASVHDAEDRRDAAIDLLWQVAQGPLYRAWVELALASRTDVYLLGAVRAVNNRIADYIEKVFPEIFGLGTGADHEELRMSPYVAFFALEGAALGGQTLEPAIAERTIKSLKFLLKRAISPREPENS
jgi:AcrR family transcriptional regulator